MAKKEKDPKMNNYHDKKREAEKMLLVGAGNNVASTPKAPAT